MRPKWAISIRTHTQSKMVIFTGKEGQTPIDLYKTVKIEAQKLRDKFTGHQVVVEIISRQVAFKPPKDSKPPKDHYWCPYCIQYRLFFWHEKSGLHKCPVCGISQEDYYVKLHNGIFKQERQDWLIHRKDKKEE